MTSKPNTKTDPKDRLATYRAKRDFDRTPEPSGAAPPPPDGNRFVVQRHRARALHYDFRLETGGVLVSWAVPKGPTLDPKARRMAVHVEDHPVDYFDFEGIIPAGEYGGGDVIVWDWGTWTTDKGTDLTSAVAAGDVHVDLHGEKLAGRFVLVRRDHKPAEREQWLMLHKNDDFAVPGWNAEDHPASVKSGRTNDEVAADPDAEWHREGAVIRSWPSPTATEIDALAAIDGEGTWSFQGRDVDVTNLDEVTHPGRDGDAPITKREVLAYHAAVAPHMLPYLVGRSTNSRDTSVDSPAALVALANDDAAVEIRLSASTTTAPQQPTWVFIDVDLGENASLDDLLLLGTLHRTAMEKLGIRAIPKVNGISGIEIWIPVGPHHTFDDTRRWVAKLSRMIAAAMPDVDRWDNARDSSDSSRIAPFSARPAPGAPVSVPIEWAELDDRDLRPDRWTIRTVLDRLAVTGDPLRPLIGLDQTLPTL